MRKFALPIIFLSLFLLGTINKAQASTIVKGRVTDLRTGRPVASAQVKLTTLSGSLIASDESNNNGKYKIENPDIPPRPLRYNLEASKEGYQPKTIKVTLKKGQTYTVDFKLKSLPPNKPPVIHSVIPEDNSLFLAGAQIALKVNASDPDRDHLEYQISIGGSIAQPWSSSNTYTWQTQASDIGAVGITCEAR
ncbi:MAG: carboxypeptidase-like regulatory domain-containing protein, partial [bacterium]|nr:carboxypeptidase-like regulatory domain-containing protein [bacterium]